MECLKPVRIINPTKYINMNHRQQMVLYVPCGKCAACQENNQKIWYFRAWHEFQNCVSQNGYVLFDCLTYRPKDVPKISRFLDVPKDLDYMCFDYMDLRKFFVRLRRKLRKYNIEHTLRYFAATEYGTVSNGTHRPHIHLLLYVTNPKLDSFTLSRAVAKCWPFGRTDGLPYKSRNYVLNNTLGCDLSSSMRVCKYVSKYVMKDSSFQSEIDKRMTNLLECVFEDYSNYYSSFDDFISSEDGKRIKKRIASHVQQFHRQSLSFGLSALENVDLMELMDNNILSIPDNNSVVMRIGLPTYYKRKLFYELINVDGQRLWSPTKLGEKYLSCRLVDLESRLYDNYKLCNLEYHLGYSNDEILALVDYSVNKRGRIKADDPALMSIYDRLKQDDLVYSYITSSDKEQFNRTFVSSLYLGCNGNYNDVKEYYSMSIEEFIQRYVCFSSFFESMLDKMEEAKKKKHLGYQKAFDRIQELNQIYKSLVEN